MQWILCRHDAILPGDHRRLRSHGVVRANMAYHPYHLHHAARHSSGSGPWCVGRAVADNGDDRGIIGEFDVLDMDGVQRHEEARRCACACRERSQPFRTGALV